MSRTRKEKCTYWLTGLLVCLLLLATCGAPTPAPVATETAVPSEPTAAPAEATAVPTQVPAPVAEEHPQEIVIANTGMAADVSTLDPLVESIVFEVNYNLFDLIVKIDRQYEGGQAVFKVSDTKSIVTSWERIDDTSWEMKVRSGVTFHDGSPLTAEDVVFSINHALDPAFASKLVTQLAGITGAELVDDETFILKTEAARAGTVEELSRVAVVPSDYYTKVGPEKFAEQPIGSGPYKFVEWVKGDHVTLEAYDGYWGGAPAIKRVVFRYVPEDATRAAAIKSGEADLVNNIPPALYADLEADPNVHAFIYHGMQHILFGLDGRTPPFSDPRVRQAMMYAIDRGEIIDTLFEGKFARPITGLIAEGLPGYDPALEDYYSYDPDKARQLLADAGYADGFETELLYTPGRYAQIDDVVQALTGYLADVGITVKLMPAEGGQRLQMIREGTVPGIFSTSCLNEQADPGACIDLWADKEAGRGWYWPDFNLDEESAQQRMTFDLEERTTLLKDINQQLVELAPFIWMYHENNGWASTPGLVIEPTWEGYTELRGAYFE
jgi:peptide/nickel transport system substrate-binding protein